MSPLGFHVAALLMTCLSIWQWMLGQIVELLIPLLARFKTYLILIEIRNLINWRKICFWAVTYTARTSCVLIVKGNCKKDRTGGNPDKV